MIWCRFYEVAFLRCGAVRCHDFWILSGPSIKITKTANENRAARRPVEDLDQNRIQRIRLGVVLLMLDRIVIVVPRRAWRAHPASSARSCACTRRTHALATPRCPALPAVPCACRPDHVSMSLVCRAQQSQTRWSVRPTSARHVRCPRRQGGPATTARASRPGPAPLRSLSARRPARPSHAGHQQPERSRDCCAPSSDPHPPTSCVAPAPDRPHRNPPARLPTSKARQTAGGLLKWGAADKKRLVAADMPLLTCAPRRPFGPSGPRRRCRAQSPSAAPTT